MQTGYVTGFSLFDFGGFPSSLRLVALLTFVLAFVACAKATPQPGEPDWLAVDDFTYQLQWARPERIGETAFDLVVVSISATGGSREVIENLKHSSGGEKIVLCYMSIGQAEDYRFYWQREWYQDPPDWLDDSDPNWAGDYWVRYWHPEWQAIIYGSPESYLDRILDLGFDGVYLDRVDTYYYYQERGRETAAREMADFVIGLAEYARQRHPGFGVFPQNAEELGLRFPDYLETVTGIGVEDLYYGYPRDHTPSPPEWTAEREVILDQWVAANKLVLTIDYTQRPEQIDDAYARARARGYVPYVTVRSLGQLIINAGYEPD
jgi:cysteinyl-tRNA synthetase